MSTSESSATPQTLRAAAWMIGTIASFTAMAIAGREVSFALDTFEIMLYRSLTGIVIMVMIVVAMGKARELRTAHPGLHLSRNIAHFTGQNLWFFAVATIPLAQVFALEFTTPIWAMLLAAVMLGERLTKVGVLSALVGFIGILIVARPSPESISPGLIAAATCAIAFGVTAVLTRRLTRTESITCILFYLTVMQAVFGVIAAGYDGDIAAPDAQTAPWLILIGIAGLVAHFCLTKALSLAPAAVVMPIDFARLPIIALVGMALYAEPLDPLVLVGGVLIFAANYVNITRTKPTSSD